MKLFEDLMEASAKFADKATKVATEAFEQTKVVAGEAMDKGKKKVNELELKAELSKAYKQLGELYYVMRKTGEENEPLLTQYYNNVAAVEAKLEALAQENAGESSFDFSEMKEDLANATEELVNEIKEVFTPDEESVNVCPSCASECADTDVYCRECGAKLGE